MSTIWVVIVAMLTMRMGFWAGCAWMTAIRPQPEVRTVFVPYYAAVRDEPEPEGFDWKSGTGVA